MYKVLVAEDEEFILQGIANLIDWEALGLQIVHMAIDGAKALEQWKEEPADIVITDINMPIISGLELLKEIRSLDERTRFIIISGYDEFEYARTAIRLDVENYILKPIDEDELEEVLKTAIKRLEEMDQEIKSHVDQQVQFGAFLSGKMGKERSMAYIQKRNLIPPSPYRAAAAMKIKLNESSNVQMAEITSWLEQQYKDRRMQVFFYDPNELMMIIDLKKEWPGELRIFFSELQNHIESKFDLSTFITVGTPFQDYMELPKIFRTMNKLEKYRLILGYGNSVDEEFISQRQTRDITVDQDKFHKLILEKDRKGITDYLEDLFINNASQGGASVTDIYRMTLRIALILQEIIEEYQLFKGKKLPNITEVVDNLYEAEDIFMIKAMFIAQVFEIIDAIHEEDCQYTPVVRQVLSEVKNNYREEMNLKTLAYKYHINTSYLGQIFQKEVGCSFSQYLSNVKNGKARELILNTNMKINDIAKEVGYPDTSYFYRKFKQCYGVSPASLREMKKY